MIDAAIDEQGNIWLLVTRNGKSDPGGKGGFALPWSGSGCRWVKYLPEHRADSLARFSEAQEFHERGEVVGA